MSDQSHEVEELLAIARKQRIVIALLEEVIADRNNAIKHMHEMIDKFIALKEISIP